MKTLIIVGVIVLGLAGLLGGAGVWFKTHGFGKQDDALAVRAEPVTRGDLVETVLAPGIIQPKTKVSISAKVAARVVELPNKEGARVTKGDPTANPPIPPSVLVRLDAKDLESQLKAVQARYDAQGAQMKVAQANVDAQEARINANKAELEDAQRDLRRQRELLDTKDVPQSVVDAATVRVEQMTASLNSALHNLRAERATLTVLQHQLEAAQAEIERAKDDLSYTVITSPIDGVVTRVNAEVGELVIMGTMNNPGTVILEVADLNTMLMNARVDEIAVAEVRIGQPAKVRVPAYKDRVFDGVVDTAALANTEEKDGTKYYKTEILLKTDGERILSGLNADAEIETKRHSNVLMVPSQAVLGRPVDELPSDLRTRPEVDKRKNYATVVYRLLDGKAVVTPVTVGASDVISTVVTAGVSEGDQIISGPYKVLEGLKHDQKVKLEKPATQPSTQPVS